MPHPDLPILPSESSHLSQKFGRETANYFSGSPLNRLSFLRADTAFLRAAYAHPSTRFLLLNALHPLVQGTDSARLAFATHADVSGLVGEDPFGKSEEEMVEGFDSREEQVVVVFLGVDEKGEVGESGEEGEVFGWKGFKGAPYFAVDVTPRGKGTQTAEALIEVVKGKGYKFHDHSPRHMGLHAGLGESTPSLYTN